MSARSLNKALLIGNLTRDPELRYTPNGTAVCSFGVATNRSWTTESGEKRDEVEFHRVVAWSKLAELCSQLLVKGRKVFVEGRLQTRTWQGQDGAQRSSTEIVIDNMIILDSRRPDMQGGTGVASENAAANTGAASTPVQAVAPVASQPAAGNDQSVKSTKTAGDDKKKVDPAVKTQENKEDINPDDIPF